MADFRLHREPSTQGSENDKKCRTRSIYADYVWRFPMGASTVFRIVSQEELPEYSTVCERSP
jgi:hypothetical protein